MIRKRSKIAVLFFSSVLFLIVTATLSVPSHAAERTTISLDGVWQIEESRESDAVPASWNHSGPVPGLTHSANPVFPDVDEFESRELILNRIQGGFLPKGAAIHAVGISHQ